MFELFLALLSACSLIRLLSLKRRSELVRVVELDGILYKVKLFRENAPKCFHNRTRLLFGSHVKNDFVDHTNHFMGYCGIEQLY